MRRIKEMVNKNRIEEIENLRILFQVMVNLEGLNVILCTLLCATSHFVFDS